MRGKFRREKRLLFYGAVRALRLLSTIRPRRAQLSVFAALGDLVRRIDRPAVRRTLSHLEIAYGNEISLRARQELMRESFREAGRNVGDMLWASRGSAAEATQIVRVSGLENLEAALARGRGAVALSAHLGNWELMGAALAAHGVPLHVVARSLFDARSDRMLNDWRRRTGIQVHTDPRLLRLVRALRSGAVVGALVDQDTRGPARFAPFFGRPARTSCTPFVLARRSGAALVPMWIRRAADGTHEVSIEPALTHSSLPDEESALIAELTLWNLKLEQEIRNRPAEWVWHHRRWKSRPGGERGEERQQEVAGMATAVGGSSNSLGTR